jgi:hypothetical protein
VPAASPPLERADYQGCLMQVQTTEARRGMEASRPTVLRGLIVRLREIEGPDRDLDCQIDTVIHRIEWRPYRDGTKMLWGHSPNGTVLRLGKDSCPAFTASLDAAQGLLQRILPGWSWQVHTGGRCEEGFHCAVWRSWGANAYRRHVAEAFPTPALAMVFALVTALTNDPEADER